ncbi:hypothetical protein [Candidatus Enterococcus clewellii]|uniref:Normocyte-binding protein n=1 Tax=Candidatus Enterococcus clewellii TaxID=1834193 RepID=A0A242KD96_9ENTE|nr:hypothetical protein [Enterococcus sp. 9E7_DIV0242]OTP19037.1 hypothetical protein A5888_000851 [Enterococcus sp. 9E7_DIV0242]
MKDLLKSRLDRIDDLNDRKLLKQIINGVFNGLVEYTEDQFEAIQQQVFNEIEDHTDQFDVYYHILPKDEVDPIADFFFPIDENDLREFEEMEQLTEAIQSTPEVLISKVYLACDYLQFQKFMRECRERVFKGTVETNQETYPVDFKIKPYSGYLEKLEQMYINFTDNSLAWKTILHPYIYKFIGVHLIENLTLAEGEKVKKISFDLQEMEPYQKIDHVPLWNVRLLEIRNESFAVPARDHINYQHTINIEKYGINHGYLVDTKAANINYVRKSIDSLTVISPNEKVLSWQIYQFLQLGERVEALDLQSNHKQDFFTDRFARRENFTVRSMCEISRIINTYSMMANFSLEKIELLEQLPPIKETYEVNTFLKDYIREEVHRTPMLLSFTTKKQGLTTRDELSFLVSEIQLHFPEFTCLGELL